MKPFLRRSLTAIAAAATVAVPHAMAAQSPVQRDAARDLARDTHLSPSGSYLAARQASLDRDPDAAAAYYKAALRFDQHNAELLERAFYSVLADGDVNEAARVAEKLVQSDRSNRDAHLVLGVRALKQKQYRDAHAHFAQAAHGQIRELVGTLLAGWASYGSGDGKGAIDSIDKLNGPDWYGIFKEMHTGLMSDLGGNKKEAGKRYEHAFKIDGTILRVMQSHAGFLSRNGGHDEALKVYEDYNKQVPRYPLTLEGISLLKQDIPLPRIVETAQEGAAEALYGIGAALGRREEELSFANPGLVYLQLALYLSPDHALAQIALADLYEGLKKPELALKLFERVPTSSPLKHSAEIALAIDLDSLERTEEAKKHLEKVIVAKPDDLEALNALAGIERERKQYGGCADTYGKVTALIPEPTKSNWTTYYFWGICHERAKQWAKAEGDFKRALELYPEQPLVLNYLGYSWIDQGVHLDDAMEMIKRSVEQRPDDGYIVDSLGWAYYRLGNYEEAVKNLERAVELKPVDPTINDHLGDVYWKVDRVLEAKFQWSHARDLKPEPDELVKIEQKLKVGLEEVKSDTPSTTAGEAKKRVGDGG